MKKLCIISLLFSSILLVGCFTQISTDTTAITPETVTITSIVEVENTEKIEELERKLALAEGKNRKYDELINNLNELLKNVYYGYASNSSFNSQFTAFSINYNDKYYLITAGHCVDEGVGNFKFKANFSDKWIYPKLLTYENEYNGGRDYAIFISDKITDGFIPNTELTYPAFILGHGDKLDNNEYNIIKLKENSVNFGGESGSPIINVNGEALGIMTGMMTNIEVVLKFIDELK